MTHFVKRIADVRDGAAALIDERGETSWEDLNRRSNRLVHALRSLGLTAGDSIALYAGNCREYYEIMMAANHAGLVYVPVNWHFSPEELAYVVADSGAKVLFAEGQFLDQARAAVARGETPDLQTCIAIRGVGETEPFQDFEAVLTGASDEEPENQGAGAQQSRRPLQFRLFPRTLPDRGDRRAQVPVGARRARNADLGQAVRLCERRTDTRGQGNCKQRRCPAKD